jgi:hypothetical protein
MSSLKKRKEMGLEEETQTDPVRRSEKDTNDMQGTEMVHATVSKHSVDPKCIPNPFIPGAPRDTSVQDVLCPQSFQDSMTTDQLTVQTVGSSVMTGGDEPGGGKGILVSNTVSVTVCLLWDQLF